MMIPGVAVRSWMMSRCICAGVSWNALASAIARRSASALEYLIRSCVRVSVRRVSSASGI